jgi:hypothetical protein
MLVENLFFSMVGIIASFILFILSIIVIRGGTQNWGKRVFFTWLFIKSIWLCSGAVSYLVADPLHFEFAQNLFYSLVFPISLLVAVFSISFSSKRVKEYFALAMVVGLVMMAFWFVVKPYNIETTTNGLNYILWEPVVIPAGLFTAFSFLIAVFNLLWISKDVEGKMHKKLRRLAILILLHMVTTLPFGFYGQLTGNAVYVPAVSGVMDSIIFALMLKVYLN